MDALRDAFAKARDADAFKVAFDDFRDASQDGRVPPTNADPALVRSFATAATRILESEQRALVAADARKREATAARAGAADKIETAEAAIAAANQTIREANEAVPSLEESQQAALAARNDLVSRLNDVVSRANALGRGEGAAAARAEARQAEADLGAQIDAHEREFNEAAGAIEGAEQRAVDATNAARLQSARAKKETERENQAVAAEQKAATDAKQRLARFDEVLGRLIAGLGFVGIESDLAALSDEAADTELRLEAATQLATRASE
jgi:chromosome segregation ATPase